MKILALEPYYDGSHKAFLDGWSKISRHEWTILTLPGYKWKWRMRHSAVTFAQQLQPFIANGQNWDILFCSDMLNLAEFYGLAPEPVKSLPSIAYFHENQLTYPVRFESERDYQFAMTNMTTAMAATKVWFNSAFHRNSFCQGLETFLKKMPDFQPIEAVEQIRNKSVIHSPCVKKKPKAAKRKSGPVRILWAARWEHDKNAEDFFEAVKVLKNKRIDFRLSVIGQSFRDVPDVFALAKKNFSKHIDYWGYQKSCADYEKVLAQADVVVSTARHEFFGISIIEAILAGAYPLLPKRLSYPEILGLNHNSDCREFFYDGSIKDLTGKLIALTKRDNQGDLWRKGTSRAIELAERFQWENRVAILDKAIAQIVQSR